MRSAFAVLLRGFVLPFGATSGRRIVFNGDTGIIQFFDSVNRLRLQLGGTTDDTSGLIQFGTGHPDQAALAQILGGALGSGAGSNARLRIAGPTISGDIGDALIDLLSGSADGTEVAAIRFGNGSVALRLFVTEATNSPMGTAVLVAGTVTVSNIWVTATSRIFLTSQVDGGTPGFLRVSARTAGTSFTITSSNAADTSTIAFIILEGF